MTQQGKSCHYLCQAMYFRVSEGAFFILQVGLPDPESPLWRGQETLKTLAWFCILPAWTSLFLC